MKQKKAQSASNSGIFLIILTVLIVLYILFIPPQERAELLNGGSGGTINDGTTTHNKEILLEENIGRVININNNEREHNLQAFIISTKEAARIIKETPSAYVATSVFEKKTKTISFKTNPELTKQIKLSLTTGRKADGKLLIYFNNKLLTETTIQPETNYLIDLPIDELKEENTLTFAASSPGAAFWHKNEYELKNIRVITKEKDISNSINEQTFFIDPNEASQTKKAKLSFYSDCEYETTGNIIISINGRNIFEGKPACGITQTIELDPKNIFPGENLIRFSTNEGIITIANLKIKTSLEDQINPTYFFKLDRELFEDEEKDLKNEYRVRMTLTYPDTERKRASILINGREITLDTYSLKSSWDISDYAIAGINSIEIIPKNDFTITAIIVELEEE